MTDRTPTPPPLDLAELTVIAKAATDGPWEAFTFPGEKGTAPYAFVEVGQHEVRLPWLDGSYLTAAHIAAFDPHTVLALIARAEAAEAKIAAVRELHTKTYVSVDNEVWGRDPRCSKCHDAYPCSTIAALDGTA